MTDRYSRLFVFAALMLGLALQPASAQTIPMKGDDATLDVATWNIEWFGAPNGPSDDERQRQNVRSVIDNAGIDLWAVQEIADPDDFDTLLDELGDEWDGALATQSTQQRIGFVWKRDLISGSIRHILSTNTYEFASRPPLLFDAIVTLPDTTVEVTFITVHMKAFSDAQSYNRRKDASVLLKNYLDFLLPNEAALVLGDFNDELGRSTFSGATSPYANFLDDRDDYRFASLDIDRANLATYCGNSPCSTGSTLDHILYTDELISAYVEGSGDRYDELLAALEAGSGYRAFVSDHLPVVARFRFEDTASSTEDGTLPRSLTVEAAYPNPFHHTTTVRYTLPQPAPVRAEAFDLLGRKVATLAEGTQPAGTHAVSFDASALPPGLYLVRVQAGEQVHTQRVVRLR